jgi:hypothetical protein
MRDLRNFLRDPQERHEEFLRDPEVHEVMRGGRFGMRKPSLAMPLERANRLEVALCGVVVPSQCLDKFKFLGKGF